MLPMLAARMMTRIMQQIMIMIFFCTGERDCEAGTWAGQGRGTRDKKTEVQGVTQSNVGSCWSLSPSWLRFGT